MPLFHFVSEEQGLQFSNDLIFSGLPRISNPIDRTDGGQPVGAVYPGQAHGSGKARSVGVVFLSE